MFRRGPGRFFFFWGQWMPESRLSDEEPSQRSTARASRFRRFFYTYVAGPLIGAVTVGVLAWLVSSTKGLFAMPAKVERLEKRAATDSARTDSLFRINAGVLSVLCFGLSDRAFEAAQQICGEAFHLSRVIAGEKVQREQK